METEKKIVFSLEEDKVYKIRGFVDRIVFNKQIEEYEVHDYKTNEWLKSQEEVDKDRQLAFYHLGLREYFGKQIKVKLIWHFLAHNRKITSRRTDEQLEDLKRKTIELIKKIEGTTHWSACGKRWCDWCSYKRNNELENYT
jgi:RecB family exonuclease